MLLFAACSGGASQGGASQGGGGGAPDAAAPDGGLDATDAPIVDACAPTGSGCLLTPIACVSSTLPTLAEESAKYDGLQPTDTCPIPALWVERYEACGRVAIHMYSSPPFTWYFDATTGETLGEETVTDTGCSGFGDPGFPCAAIPSCAHLCGSSSGIFEQPKCPPFLDAGASDAPHD